MSKCEWTEKEEYDEFYSHTSCDNMHQFTNVRMWFAIENGNKFCQFCGKEIVIGKDSAPK